MITMLMVVTAHLAQQAQAQPPTLRGVSAMNPQDATAEPQEFPAAVPSSQPTEEDLANFAIQIQPI